MCAKIFQILTTVSMSHSIRHSGQFCPGGLYCQQYSTDGCGHRSRGTRRFHRSHGGYRHNRCRSSQHHYSAPITNNSSSEITISGTGALAGSTVDLDRATNSLLVRVAAGGQLGDSLEISGVRVAIAGLNLSQVTAAISSPDPMANSLTAGETNPIVIAKIMQPFSIDQGANPPLSYATWHRDPMVDLFYHRRNLPECFCRQRGRYRSYPYCPLSFHSGRSPDHFPRIGRFRRRNVQNDFGKP